MKAGDWVNGGVNAERQKVGNKEYSEPATDHSLRVKTIGDAQTRHELMFVERQTVSATVYAGLDQEQVPGTAASCAPIAPPDRIRDARIEVGQPVEALRPG